MNYFSEKDIASLISMKTCIELMKTAFSDISAKESYVPVRTHLPLKGANANALFMPVFSNKLNVYGIKNVSIIPENVEKGIPRTSAHFLLYDGNTGKLLSLMDAETITSLRTGAASGLATDYLSLSDANCLAIFGTGEQAYYQVSAVLSVREIKTILIFATNELKANQFAKRLKPIMPKGCVCITENPTLSTADIICTATSSQTPVFKPMPLKRSVHINGVGSYTPKMAEVPAETVRSSTIFVDQIEACFSEAGDILQAIEHGFIKGSDITYELGDIPLKKMNTQQFKNRTTFFKSVGNAVQDLYVAHYIWNTFHQNTKV